MTARKQFTKDAICDYWETDARVPFAMTNVCWRCKKITALTEKAHIVALCDGGTDTPDNIHLLCRRCHSDSEFMHGEAYWDWFKAGPADMYAWVFQNLGDLELRGVMSREMARKFARVYKKHVKLQAKLGIQ